MDVCARFPGVCAHFPGVCAHLTRLCAHLSSASAHLMGACAHHVAGCRSRSTTLQVYIMASSCGRHSCHHPQSQHLPCRSASPPLTCPSRPTCSLTDHAPCSTSAAGCSTSGSTMRAASMRGKHSPQNPIRFLRGGPGWGIGRGAGTGTRDQPVYHQKAEKGSRKGGRRRGDARLSTQHLNKHRDHVACDLDTPQDATYDPWSA